MHSTVPNTWIIDLGQHEPQTQTFAPEKCMYCFPQASSLWKGMVRVRDRLEKEKECICIFSMVPEDRINCTQSEVINFNGSLIYVFIIPSKKEQAVYKARRAVQQCNHNWQMGQVFVGLMYIIQLLHKLVNFQTSKAIKS